uniref:Actin-related protein 10 n=1 Tax=Rhabditophanes sp. KR3021 TaxID=114890 RepID=A0AC35UFU8_9BILA
MSTTSEFAKSIPRKAIHIPASTPRSTIALSSGTSSPHITSSRVDNLITKGNVVKSKGAIVIEFGNKLTKIGISGEYQPRSVIRSQISLPNETKEIPVFANDYSEVQQKTLLTAFMKKIFYQILIGPLKERNILIVQRCFCNERIEKIITGIFKVKPSFCPKEIKFLTSEVAASIALYCSEALLAVDIGFTYSSVVPIIHYNLLMQEGEISMAGAEALEKKVRELLLSEGKVTINATREVKAIDEEIIKILDQTKIYEDICNKYLLVTTFDRSRKLGTAEQESAPKSVEIPIGSEYTIIVSGKIRETAAEVFFGSDIDTITIPEAILATLISCPLDYRRSLFERISVTGGASTIPGFLGRLRKELEFAVTTDSYKELRKIGSPAFVLYENANITTGLVTNWIGGSLYGTYTYK